MTSFLESMEDKLSPERECVSFQSLLETNEARWLTNDNEETRVYFLANSLRAEECKLPTYSSLLGT